MALEDELLRQRHDRIAQIQQLGFQPYGHAFEFTHTIPHILSEYSGKTAEGIFHCARDNAVGVGSLIELGNAFTKLPSPPKRSIVFLNCRDRPRRSTTAGSRSPARRQTTWQIGVFVTVYLGRQTGQ